MGCNMRRPGNRDPSRTGIKGHGEKKILVRRGNEETVRLSHQRGGMPFWQSMQKIWEVQRARGHIPRAVEEVESQRQTFRQEMKDEIQEDMRLQEECRRARDPASAAQGPNA
jgi:hypothetical protein